MTFRGITATLRTWRPSRAVDDPAVRYELYDMRTGTVVDAYDSPTELLRAGIELGQRQPGIWSANFDAYAVQRERPE